MRLITIFLLIVSSTAWGLELNNLNKLKPCPKDQTAGFHNCWGTYSLANGNKYVGEFQHGKRNGQGTLTYAHGDKYVGEFKDGNYHGKGIETFTAGGSYFGDYKGGKRNGQGTHTFVNGDKYVGEFRDDDYNGQGTFTFANGGDSLASGKTTNPMEEELKLMQMEVLPRKVSLKTVNSFAPKNSIYRGNPTSEIGFLDGEPLARLKHCNRLETSG